MKVKTFLVLFVIVGFLTLSFSQTSISKLLFHDDFEKDKIGSEPSQYVCALASSTTIVRLNSALMSTRQTTF